MRLLFPSPCVMAPTLSEAHPRSFRSTVHGTVFCDRASHVSALGKGDDLLLIPDPPGQDAPAVWVHRMEGDPIGHLPPEINSWLAPWMMSGGSARAKAVRVGSERVPSWKRLVIEVSI